MYRDDLLLVDTISQNLHPQIWVLRSCHILYCKRVTLSVPFTLNVLQIDISSNINTFTVKEIKNIIPLLSAICNRKLDQN
jgi:hypothetical protein